MSKAKAKKVAAIEIAYDAFCDAQAAHDGPEDRSPRGHLSYISNLSVSSKSYLNEAAAQAAADNLNHRRESFENAVWKMAEKKGHKRAEVLATLQKIDLYGSEGSLLLSKGRISCQLTDSEKMFLIGELI